MSENSGLILAIDVYDAARAEELARLAEGNVRALKINWPLVLGAGSGIIGKLSRYADVLCDFKIADIPNTNRLITEKARDKGAWGIITHTFTGRDSLEAVVEASGEMKVFGVVAMSHPGASDFMEGHRKMLLEAAKAAGVYGIIAPGNNYAITRELKSEAGSLKIASPGVGAQGGSAAEAVRSGSDYIIAGRSIYGSDNPEERILALNREIMGARQSMKRSVSNISDC